MNVGLGLKKKKLLKKSLVVMALVSLPGVALAADNGQVAGLKLSLQGFGEYDAGQTGQAGGGHTNYNQFTLSRGYVTVTKGITPWLSGRVTTDIYQDNNSGNSKGSWNIRLKYLYAQANIPNLAILTNMKSEVGQGHTPWLDFEESVNTLRAQSPMITDRGGMQTSADIGVDLLGNFGGKLADAAARVGNTHYDGRYGTWHIGVYNGSGYHASEANQNKLVQARLTVRPLPDALPGLQLSYFGAFGKGNTAASPDYNLNQGMVSFQHPDFILYGLYFHSKGNYSGTLVDGTGAPLNATGYTFFGKYNLPVLEKKLSVFGRYDHVNDDDDHVIASDADYSMYVGGVSYELFKGNQVLVDYEKVDYGVNSGGMGKAAKVGNNLGNDNRIQVVYQFEF
jgi:hypothetical protein